MKELIIGMNIPRRNQVIVWGFIVVATLTNIVGYIWNLYKQIWLSDEVLHAFTTFALSLLAGVLLYEVILVGSHTRPILFILAVASLGLAIGAVWEIAEWAYDQIIPANIILGKNDTIIDLIVDLIGSLIAGFVIRSMVQPRSISKNSN